MEAPTLEQIEKILEGIDKEETSEQRGWWETSSGAEFGKDKLAEIRALFTTTKSDHVAV